MTKPEVIADAAAGVSVAAVLGITLNDWDTIISITAGLVAIVAGICAAAFHLVRIHKLNNKG